jgi:hypothetical protein
MRTALRRPTDNNCRSRIWSEHAASHVTSKESPACDSNSRHRPSLEHAKHHVRERLDRVLHLIHDGGLQPEEVAGESST